MRLDREEWARLTEPPAHVVDVVDSTVVLIEDTPNELRYALALELRHHESRDVWRQVMFLGRAELEALVWSAHGAAPWLTGG